MHACPHSTSRSGRQWKLAWGLEDWLLSLPPPPFSPVVPVLAKGINQCAISIMWSQKEFIRNQLDRGDSAETMPCCFKGLSALSKLNWLISLNIIVTSAHIAEYSKTNYNLNMQSMSKSSFSKVVALFSKVVALSNGHWARTVGKLEPGPLEKTNLHTLAYSLVLEW